MSPQFDRLTRSFVNLPGIRDSLTSNAPGQQAEIAASANETLEARDIESPIIVGYDVGGQIAFSYLCGFERSVTGVVIMDVVMPGLMPWEEVLRNSYIRHFAVHPVTELPEILVAGKEREYSEFFCTVIAAHPERISEETKDEYIRAYSSPGSLTAGLNRYRGFADDAKRNRLIAAGRRRSRCRYSI